MVFKIIKQKSFSFTNSEDVAETGIAYTLAYKGRVFQASTLNFENNELKADGNKLTISGDIDAVKAPYVNSLGETVNGVKLMPKLDMVLSDF